MHINFQKLLKNIVQKKIYFLMYYGILWLELIYWFDPSLYSENVKEKYT